MAFENAHAIADSDSKSLWMGSAAKSAFSARRMAAPKRFVFRAHSGNSLSVLCVVSGDEFGVGVESADGLGRKERILCAQDGRAKEVCVPSTF